ncbi:MAG: protein serine/threonine [Prolixibacteraceae bacterium]|nr:MAG: protein serine/threonine [Prolixibacteraceae bacterium]
MKVFHYSDIGLRTNNEDHISLSDFAFVLCDGVGGIDNGEIASKTVSESFIKEITSYKSNEITSTLIKKVITKIQIDLNQIAIEKPVLNGIGTTFCAAVFSEKELICVHIGDSRIYIIDTFEEKYWRTNDHTISSELIKSGILEKSKSRNHPFANKLTRAIQADPGIELASSDIQQFKNIDSRYLIFICSDGVNEVLDDFELVNTLCRKNLNLENRFIQIRNYCKHNAKDNNSAILIQPEIEFNPLKTQTEQENLWIYLKENECDKEKNHKKKWWKIFDGETSLKLNLEKC